MPLPIDAEPPAQLSDILVANPRLKAAAVIAPLVSGGAALFLVRFQARGCSWTTRPVGDPSDGGDLDVVEHLGRLRLGAWWNQWPGPCWPNLVPAASATVIRSAVSVVMLFCAPSATMWLPTFTDAAVVVDDPL